MSRWKKLGVIAGGNALPLTVAAATAARNEDIFFVRLKGLADPELDQYPGVDCALGEAGKIIRSLKDANCDAVLLAGMVQRPELKDLKVDWRGAAILPGLLAAASKGDGAILEFLVKTLESEGFIVIGVDEAVNDLLATEGAIGKVTPDAQSLSDIRKAAAVVRALGEFDIGQGAVVANGLVLAIEAAEGTDAMLDRCGTLPNNIQAGGVLVKRPKPGQELRVDLPVIGTETIRRAAAVGLSGIAIEASVALIVDRPKVIKLADQAGLFVYGFKEVDLRNA
ncbi:LpxI family protein [Hyphococcus sp. DH-69]|uniref:LpxI family protein n=1 Tax=Hyphococcus formosus TaxID=3143534 RepID=UPI00398BB793